MSEPLDSIFPRETVGGARRLDDVACPQCRADVPAGARFCPSCGHELVVVGDQRRIATVLFADLVGFTALSEQLDPEQVKGLVDRCFKRLAADIEAFGGRVDKVVGDAIVALFGAPVAHEDDAERAVRAGLRMQETIRDLDETAQIRVGINTGEVLVGAVQGGREYTAMGDVVNTASRLQVAADPGMVLVGPATYEATSEVIGYDAIEPVVAKGKQLPVEAWVATEALGPPGYRRRHGWTPLIGREAELTLLTSVASTAIDRSRASILLVHGEAGMGKSRLAEELVGYAARELGVVTLEGRCVPYGEANVWWPVADAIRTAAGIAPDASFDQIDGAIRKFTRVALEQSGRVDELERIVDGLHHLMGHETLKEIEASRARDEVVRSVVAVAEGFTHRGPVLVVFSDMHWADDAVLELADTLLRRLARRPFVFLATARRSLSDRWTPEPGAANSVALHLDPLDDDACRRLLMSLTGGEIESELADMLISRAGGNPFYLEELVSLVREAGVHSVRELLDTEAGDLPSTLRGLVAARLDALPPLVRAVLDDAAVLGRQSAIGGLAKMLEVKRRLDPETARAHIENLAAREFLVIEGDQYAFRSDVIREVAYSTLTKSDRARAHAGIAQWIEGHHAASDGDGDKSELDFEILVANHYAAAAELVAEIGHVSGVVEDVSDRAVKWLLQAIDRAGHDFTPSMVVSLAERALVLMTDGDDRRGPLLLKRAGALADQYRLDEAEADLRQAMELASNDDDLLAAARAGLVAAEIAQHRGDMVAAIGNLEGSLATFEEHGDDEGRADAYRQLGLTHLLTGDTLVADTALGKALALYETLGSARGVAWAQQHLSWSAYMSGNIVEAEARLDKAMAAFGELGDPGGMTWSRGLLAWVRFHQGKTQEALTLAEEVRFDARERGERWGEAMMTVLVGVIALWAGRTSDAVEELRVATDCFDSIDDQFGAIQAQCSLARARVMCGDLEGGMAELERIRARADASAGGQHWLVTMMELALAVQLGETDLVPNVFMQSHGTADDGLPFNADRLVGESLARLQRGDVQGARCSLDGVDEERGYVDAARALVAAVEGNHRTALRHAEEVIRHPYTYVDEAMADVARAIAHVGLGDTEAANNVIGQRLEGLAVMEDAVARAVVHLTDAAIASATGRSDAVAAVSRADRALGLAGIEAKGWKTILELGLSNDRVRSE